MSDRYTQEPTESRCSTRNPSVSTALYAVLRGLGLNKYIEKDASVPGVEKEGQPKVTREGPVSESRDDNMIPLDSDIYVLLVSAPNHLFGALSDEG